MSALYQIANPAKGGEAAPPCGLTPPPATPLIGGDSRQPRPPCTRAEILAGLAGMADDLDGPHAHIAIPLIARRLRLACNDIERWSARELIG